MVWRSGKFDSEWPGHARIVSQYLHDQSKNESQSCRITKKGRACLYNASPWKGKRQDLPPSFHAALKKQHMPPSYNQKSLGKAIGKAWAHHMCHLFIKKSLHVHVINDLISFERAILLGIAAKLGHCNFSKKIMKFILKKSWGLIVIIFYKYHPQLIKIPNQTATITLLPDLIDDGSISDS